MSFGFKHTKDTDENGPFEKIGFWKQGKKRQRQCFDAEAALVYFRRLQFTDPAMFWRHSTDKEGRLEHLFWCDGTSQMDYAVFGDVLAFDTTYRKDKYMSPLVLFSGVNHHNQTTLFASAFVANETEETYMWLLEQFLIAMKGKTPISVITEDKVAMRSSIRRVFPNAYHRLCGFNLLRNARINVKNARFVEEFKKCMFGEYEVGEFEHKWDEMVKEFGVEHNSWISEMYEKRKMWATAYIRGHFFAVYRTTSRCTGLRSHLGKFIDSHNNISEFLQRFMKFLGSMRHNELEADFRSVYGEPVLITQLKPLEKSASKLFTRAIFFLFRSVLQEACKVIVVDCKQTPMCSIYTVHKYQEVKEWCVSFCPSTFELKCSCLKMESLGIPCDHLVGVMKQLDIAELPKCLVLYRWTKNVKESIEGVNYHPSIVWDPMFMTLHGSLLDSCRQMCTLACHTAKGFEDTREKVRCHIEMLQAKNGRQRDDEVSLDPHFGSTVKNSARVKSKECGATSLSVKTKGKETRRCGVCRAEGHNRRSCPVQIHNDNIVRDDDDDNSIFYDDNADVDDDDCDFSDFNSNAEDDDDDDGDDNDNDNDNYFYNYNADADTVSTN